MRLYLVGREGFVINRCFVNAAVEPLVPNRRVSSLARSDEDGINGGAGSAAGWTSGAGFGAVHVNAHRACSLVVRPDDVLPCAIRPHARCGNSSTSSRGLGTVLNIESVKSTDHIKGELISHAPSVGSIAFGKNRCAGHLYGSAFDPRFHTETRTCAGEIYSCDFAHELVLSGKPDRGISVVNRVSGQAERDRMVLAVMTAPVVKRHRPIGFAQPI